MSKSTLFSASFNALYSLRLGSLSYNDGGMVISVGVYDIAGIELAVDLGWLFEGGAWGGTTCWLGNGT